MDAPIIAAGDPARNKRIDERPLPASDAAMSLLSYEVRGEGPTVALLHGFPLDRRIWNDVALALAASARVITIDLRGFGQSKAFDPFTMDSQADDVHALLG